MPIKKMQSLKAISSVQAQPQELTSRIEAILLMDLAGHGTCAIAEALGLTAGRVSVIKTSPLYIEAKAARKKSLNQEFDRVATDKLVHGDPVQQFIKDKALTAAQTAYEVMTEGRSEFAKLSAANSLMDRAGYKAREEKTVVSVSITEKMADRFEAALKFKREC